MSIYVKALPEHVALSGPVIWPHLSGELAVNRFIHRRPELAYHYAMDKIREDGSGQTSIRVKIFRVHHDRGRKTKVVGRFHFHAAYDTPLEDTRIFLETLRRFLRVHVTVTPTLKFSIVLRFHHPLNHELIKSFQQPWI